MRVAAMLLTLTALSLGQAIATDPPGAQPDLFWWRASAVTLTAASAVDIHSSWGKCCEANRLLPAPGGRFGRDAALVKTGALGAQLLLQHLAARKRPGWRKFFTIVNFSVSGFTSSSPPTTTGSPGGLCPSPG